MRSDNFKIIKEILVKIEEQLDEKSIDWSRFDYESLNMSKPRWIRIMEMLNEDGAIRGFSYSGEAGNPSNIEVSNIRLTLRGLEMAESAKKGKFDVTLLIS
jgi:hypothetical protein